MALTDAQLESDFDGVDDDFPVTIAYGSVTGIAGTKSTVAADPVLEMRGVLTDYRFSVWARVDAFTAGVPVPNRAVTIDGTQYQILNTRSDGAVIRLDVGDINA